ncbi:MAG: hypothetical protein KC621_16325 [Myxococcales bacterium]|nr:hypothetical protein [Myxococcales bacterium]
MLPALAGVAALLLVIAGPYLSVGTHPAWLAIGGASGLLALILRRPRPITLRQDSVLVGSQMVTDPQAVQTLLDEGGLRRPPSLPSTQQWVFVHPLAARIDRRELALLPLLALGVLPFGLSWTLLALALASGPLVLAAGVQHALRPRAFALTGRHVLLDGERTPLDTVDADALAATLARLERLGYQADWPTVQTRVQIAVRRRTLFAGTGKRR